MVKLICSKEQALNNIEISAKEATLKDFVKFIRQIEGGGNYENKLHGRGMGKIHKKQRK